MSVSPTGGGSQQTPIDPSSISVLTPAQQLQQLEQQYQVSSGIEVLQALQQEINSLVASEGTAGQSSAVATQANQLALTEVQGLLQLVNQLQDQPLMIGASNSGNGTVTQAQETQITNTLASAKQQLTAIQSGLTATPPTMPSESQLNALPGILNQLNGIVSNFPQQIQAQYWNSQTSMLSQLNSITQTILNTGPSASEISTLVQMEQNLNTLSTQQPISLQLLQQTIVDMGSLSSLGLLTPTAKTAMLNELNQLQNSVQFNTFNPLSGLGTDQTFSQTAAQSIIFQWVQSYIAQPPGNTSLGDYLQTQMTNMFNGVDLSQNPGAAALQTALNNGINAPMGLGSSESLSTAAFEALSGSPPLTLTQFMNEPNAIVGFTTPSSDPDAVGLASLQDQLSWLTQTLASVQSSGGTIPADSLETMLSMLSNLQSNLSTLPPDQQAMANDVLNQLNQSLVFTDTVSQQTMTLPQLMQNYANNPSTTELDTYQVTTSNKAPITTVPVSTITLQNEVSWLSTTLNAYQESGNLMPANILKGILPMLSSLQATENQLPSPIQSQVKQLLKMAQFSQQGGASNQSISDIISLYQSNPTQFMSAPFTVGSTSGQPLPVFVAGAPISLNLSSITATSNELSVAAAALAPFLPDLENINPQLQNAEVAPAVQAAIVGQAGGTSLQDLFSMIILNHFMPGQEAYLNDQANQLNFSNWAASQYNDLIQDTASFSGASSVIDFAQGLSNPSTTTLKGGSAQITSGYNEAFPGSYASAQANLTNEQNAVTQDLTSAKQSQAKIQQLLEDLTPPGTPGTNGTAQYLDNPSLASQITALRASLTNELNLLGGTTGGGGIIGRLSQLQSYLSLIEVVPPSAQIVQGKTTTPTGWTPNDHYTVVFKGADGTLSPISSNDINTITNAENAVVQGTATEKGLDDINQEFKNQSQNFANQSQSQQMQLQLVMTEVQQEWTVVSTALQILNQVYMSLAKGIFSG